jgi:hypothetical protein
MLEPREIQSWRTLTATMLRHAGADDPAAMRQVADILAEATANLAQVAAELRSDRADGAGAGAGGYSWTDVGAAFGISRQAAAQRFGGAK